MNALHEFSTLKTSNMKPGYLSDNTLSKPQSKDCVISLMFATVFLQQRYLNAGGEFENGVTGIVILY